MCILLQPRQKSRQQGLTVGFEFMAAERGLMDASCVDDTVDSAAAGGLCSHLEARSTREFHFYRPNPRNGKTVLS